MVTPYNGGPWGDAIFTSNTNWTCPAGVTSVSVVCVGSGARGYQNGGGGGGGLGWKNNISVNPGQSYKIQVGPGITNADNNVYDGVTSYFHTESTVAGLGGKAPTGAKSTGLYDPGKSTGGYTTYLFPVTEGGKGGGFVGDGGGKGGDGGWGFTGGIDARPGGGGAGGYLGKGGEGASASGTYGGPATKTAYNGITNTIVGVVTGNVTVNFYPTTGYSGSGGGGGGGGSTVNIISQLGDYRNGGGGVGVYGTSGIISSGKPPGGFGSGEGSTSSIFGITNGKVNGSIKGKDYTMSAGSYGGGGSAYNYTEGTTYGSFPNTLITKSGGGVVRIVWPGNARNFPSDFVGRNSVNISANVATVNEGASVAFTITTTGYPDNFPFYWRTTDGAMTVSADDFTDTANTGNFTIKNGQAVVTRSLAADFMLEGPETIVFEVATGSIREKALGSSTVIVNDTSIPSVTITANKNPSIPLNEGEAIEFTVRTLAPIPNRTFYWENIGTTELSDFDEGINFGTITTGADGTAKILLTIKNDFTTEIVETILIRIKDTAQATTTRVTSSTFSVTDTSKTLIPKYVLSTEQKSVDEGAEITFTLRYENIPITTKITLSPVSSGVKFADASDYVGPEEYIFTKASPGFSETNNNCCTGSIPLKVTIRLDQKTEGVEYLTMGILDANKRPLATSTPITINDTSTTPAPTYSIDTDRVTEINESEAVTFTIKTTNLPPNTALTWTNKGTTEVSDFSSISVNGKTLGTMAMTGTVPIVNDKGTITFLTKNDLELEGTQNISLEIKNGTNIVIQPTTNSVKVKDTSIPIPYYEAIPEKNEISEGDTVKFNVKTKNVPVNAKIYWAATGNIQDSDVSPPKGGPLDLVNGAGSISITARKDYVTGERNESFYLEFRTGSTSGGAYYTSPSVIIKANDT